MAFFRSTEDRLKAAYYLFHIFCLYLIISRSLSLPIQGDEAGTYLRHALGGPGALFNLGTANNHFLNTLLIKATTFKAEFSEIAIRLPTLGIYFWFFFSYVPKRLYRKDWVAKIIFSGLSLFPYYFNEYASMARGYVMSGIFACCSINELSILPSLSRQKDFCQANIRVFLYTSLSTLSSIITFPLFLTALPTAFLVSKQRLARNKNYIRYNLPQLALAVGTLVLTIYTFASIKLTGVGTINAPKTSPISWILNINDILWLPASSTANSYGSDTPILAIVVTCFAWITFAICLLTKNLRMPVRIGIACLFGSLLLLYALALTGNYPTGRGLIPYWLPICYASTSWLSLDSYKAQDKSISPTMIKQFTDILTLVALSLLLVTAANLARNYETKYVNELRPFYYQYKSLMHYSRSQNLQCLSYGDINDEVLKFYFLNPNGSVPRPQECPPGKKSQYGFMPYSLDNKEPSFSN